MQHDTIILNVNYSPALPIFRFQKLVIPETMKARLLGQKCPSRLWYRTWHKPQKGDAFIVSGYTNRRTILGMNIPILSVYFVSVYFVDTAQNKVWYELQVELCSKKEAGRKLLFRAKDQCLIIPEVPSWTTGNDQLSKPLSIYLFQPFLGCRLWTYLQTRLLLPPSRPTRWWEWVRRPV